MLTSTGVVVGHGPLEREQTKQEGYSRRPPTSAVDDTLAPEHITRGMHFAARSGGKEDNDDDFGQDIRGNKIVVMVKNILQVAPKLTKTKPLVNFAKYLVDRQF